MKAISPTAFIAAIAVVLLVVTVIAVWVWRAPSVSVGKPPSRAEINAVMKESHGGPTPDQLKEIQEWKQTHPDGYTKH